MTVQEQLSCDKVYQTNNKYDNNLVEQVIINAT